VWICLPNALHHPEAAHPKLSNACTTFRLKRSFSKVEIYFSFPTVITLTHIIIINPHTSTYQQITTSHSDTPTITNTLTHECSTQHVITVISTFHRHSHQHICTGQRINTSTHKDIDTAIKTYCVADCVLAIDALMRC
jgi:hypothetical protein